MNSDETDIPGCTRQTVEQLLTLSEVAQFLRISTRHLRGLASAGEIAFINLGTKNRFTMRFRQADLDAFIEARIVHRQPKSRRSEHAAPAAAGGVDFLAILASRKAAKKR